MGLRKITKHDTSRHVLAHKAQESELNTSRLAFSAADWVFCGIKECFCLFYAPIIEYVRLEILMEAGSFPDIEGAGSKSLATNEGLPAVSEGTRWT